MEIFNTVVYLEVKCISGCIFQWGFAFGIGGFVFWAIFSHFTVCGIVKRAHAPVSLIDSYSICMRLAQCSLPVCLWREWNRRENERKRREKRISVDWN